MLRVRTMIGPGGDVPTPNEHYIIGNYTGANVTILGSAYDIANIVNVECEGKKLGAVKTYNFTGDKARAIKIYVKGTTRTCSHMFDGCSTLTSVDLSHFKMAKITDISFMFANCKAFTGGTMSNLDWSNVTTAASMFAECTALTDATFTNVKSPILADMSSMFLYTGLKSCDMSGLDTRSVTTMASMFEGCYYLASFKLMTPVTKLTNVDRMFRIVFTFGTFYHNKNYDYTIIIDKMPFFMWSDQAV